MPAQRLRLAVASVVLTLAYVALAILDPAVATPIGFVYLVLVLGLHCWSLGLRRRSP